MRILLVAAVAMELSPVLARLGPADGPDLRLTRYRYNGHDVEVLLTGVGMVAAAAWCSRTMTERGYDLAINTGVCGSFDPSLELGSVVHVVRDRIAELGAEDGEQLLSLTDLGLNEQEGQVFTGEALVNLSPPPNRVLDALPVVSAITVNTVHGNARTIAAVAQRFQPQVETMEGAAFMYSCLIHEVPFAQVRAVSNVVEPRNRAAWRMREAIDRLGEVTTGILETV